MKILLIAKGFPPITGGLEKYSEQVALAYAKAGHCVTVLTSHTGKTGLETKQGLKVINVGLGPQLKVFVLMLNALFKIRKTDHFDFVHATSWRVALPAIILLKPMHLLITIHGREVFVVPSILRPLMHRVFQRANYIIAVSQPILDAFKSSLPFKLKQAEAVWNGVSLTPVGQDLVAKSDPSHIFCMCRLVARKNLVAAVKAMAILAREGIEFTFHIAGSGPEKNAIKKAISEENSGKQIKYLGRISDDDALSEYYRAGIFLHPQIATEGGGDLEGFGIAIADAMIFGCIAVAGNSGGPMDFISDGENGILVDGRSPTAIADAVRPLLLNTDMQKNIAEEGRKFACSKLTWDIHVEKILLHLTK